MFSTHRVLLAAALLAAAPAPALLAQTGQPGGHEQHQQHGGRGQGQRQRGPGNPVARLLEHRADLKLSAAQVSRLETIQRDLERQNQPLAQQLQGFRGQRGQGGARAQGAQPTEAERQAMRQRFEQARPVMEKLRENNRAAAQSARQVLSAEQQQAAQRYLRDGRGERGQRGEHGRGERGGRGQRGAQGQARTR